MNNSTVLPLGLRLRRGCDQAIRATDRKSFSTSQAYDAAVEAAARTLVVLGFLLPSGETAAVLQVKTQAHDSDLPPICGLGPRLPERNGIHCVERSQYIGSACQDLHGGGKSAFLPRSLHSFLKSRPNLRAVISRSESLPYEGSLRTLKAFTGR